MSVHTSSPTPKLLAHLERTKSHDITVPIVQRMMGNLTQRPFVLKDRSALKVPELTTTLSAVLATPIRWIRFVSVETLLSRPSWMSIEELMEAEGLQFGKTLDVHNTPGMSYEKFSVLEDILHGRNIEMDEESVDGEWVPIALGDEVGDLNQYEIVTHHTTTQLPEAADTFMRELHSLYFTDEKECSDRALRALVQCAGSCLPLCHHESMEDVVYVLVK